MKLQLLPTVLLAVSLTACATPPDPADVVFRGGAVYTVEPDMPWAEAVAVRGNEIVAVLEDAAGAERFIGPRTRVIELDGRMLLPGFIDGHTHFNRAGALLRDINLLKVVDDAGLEAEVARVADLLDPGEWITGGYWGAYEQWAEGTSAAGAAAVTRWHPNRAMVDDLTPENPLLVWSFERDPELYLANTAALTAADLLEEPVDGMEVDAEGRPTGLLFKGSPAVERLRAAVAPKSPQRLLDESRAALAVLARSGIVEIHDITPDDQMRRFVELERAGELTVRVWMRADLARAAEFAERGIRMNTHPVTGERDRFLRWGAYKGYIDGIMGNHSALFFEPYDDMPGHSGYYRPHSSDDPPPHVTGNMEKLYGYLETAAANGFVANVHAIDTKGVALMLDAYERLKREEGIDLTGYRVIHAQVIRAQDFPRFRTLGVIAEVNPFHLSDDMRWMEERIGHERSKGAYAFHSLLDNGATLVFASDWPGTNAAEYHVHPKYLLHAAVNRTTVTGEPQGGWFPEQKIDLEEAIRAYTIEGARATFDGDVRGSIRVGKRADLVVLDRNLFTVPPETLLETEVELTMIDGRIVFESTRDRKAGMSASRRSAGTAG